MAKTFTEYAFRLESRNQGNSSKYRSSTLATKAPSKQLKLFMAQALTLATNATKKASAVQLFAKQIKTLSGSVQICIDRLLIISKSEGGNQELVG